MQVWYFNTWRFGFDPGISESWSKKNDRNDDKRGQKVVNRLENIDIKKEKRGKKMPLKYSVKPDAVQHPTATKVQKPEEVQAMIRQFHKEVHRRLGEDDIIDFNDVNVFIYDDEPGDPAQGDDGTYYGIPGIEEADDIVRGANEEEESSTYDQYIGVEVQLPDRIKASTEWHEFENA